MSEEQTNVPQELKQRYRQVMARVEAAAGRAGRDPKDVLVVAVTKFATTDLIRSLVDMGHCDFGENRVQQLQQRVPMISEFLARKRTLARALPSDRTFAPDRVRWHMIGHLQRNKVKHVAPIVSLVHSVDSLRLAEELHSFGSKQDMVIDVLIQVNVSGEASKYGIVPAAVVHLAEQMDQMMHLRLRGLMTIAPQAEDPEDVRPLFQRTRELFEDVRSESFITNAFNILSMGMTDDFEVAIEEGANVVRVGRAIFGDTPTPDEE